MIYACNKILFNSSQTTDTGDNIDELQKQAN